MIRVPVQSSNIRSIGHDPLTNTLEVEFVNGGVYQYDGVPAEKHSALVGAESIGRHLHQHIKQNHAARKLP